MSKLYVIVGHSGPVSSPMTLLKLINLNGLLPTDDEFIRLADMAIGAVTTVTANPGQVSVQRIDETEAARGGPIEPPLVDKKIYRLVDSVTQADNVCSLTDIFYKFSLEFDEEEILAVVNLAAGDVLRLDESRMEITCLSDNIPRQIEKRFINKSWTRYTKTTESIETLDSLDISITDFTLDQADAITSMKVGECLDIDGDGSVLVTRKS
jgi:hypothetical protein